VVVLLEGADEDLPVAAVLGAEPYRSVIRWNGYFSSGVTIGPRYSVRDCDGVSARFTKMKPAHTSQCTVTNPSSALSMSKNSSSWWMNAQAPSAW
jgi:hypothetical protein